MASVSNTIKEVSKFEPLIIDLLKQQINGQHARIIAMMFKLGGYTTLNKLTKELPFAQPTVSIRVTELVEMGYLRKNTELMPMVLVLLLSIDELESQLRYKIEKQKSAIDFLKKMSKFRDKELFKDTFIRAVNVLYDHEEILANMISNTYLKGIIARNELFQLLEMDSVESKSIKGTFESILSSHDDIFYTIFQKQKKSETFIRPRLPLRLFTNYRISYLESLYSHYEELISELANYMSSEYESIDLHQKLKYHSSIKQRIDICLKSYSQVKIIDNSIYKGKESEKGLLDLITSSKYYESYHEVKILTSKSNKPSKTIQNQRIEKKMFTKQISRDFMTRDFIIFNNNGCLVFHSKPKGSFSEYIIFPSYVTEILTIFESNWS
ncbi:MAG: hypothetical protein ACXAC6_04585 [Candidatus Hodarchaeales archaeon]|jgi:predicted transcriptional regulator